MSNCEQTMLSSRPSSEMHFVRPEMACLDMVYGAEKTRGVYAEMEPLLMILSISSPGSSSTAVPVSGTELGYGRLRGRA